MSQSERIRLIHDLLLSQRQPVSFRALKERFEVSDSTLKRDLDFLRDRYRMPIVWERERRGYRLELGPDDARKYELPGLWFNASEIHALLAMQHLLQNVTPGLLTHHLAPLKAQIRALLDKSDHAPDEIEQRIRLLSIAQRPVPLEHFETIAHAVLSRQRLLITHYHRQRNETLKREVSPQRLVHYRDNWYLDTWDHLRHDIREFALDAITAVELLGTAAKNISEKKLDSALAEGYGIFAGKPLAKAVLRFTAERARWVARERWHPRQVSKILKDGRYELRIPYADPRELVMDILKYGPDVEVVAPVALRDEVAARLEAAVGRYRGKKIS